MGYVAPCGRWDRAKRARPHTHSLHVRIMREIEVVLKDIQNYIPVDDEWEALDELIREACEFNDPRVIKPLLELLERNPDHDGYGVFWSIVHGLEYIGGYETELASSVLNKPHEMSVLMLNRMLNGGIQTIDGRSIMEILKEIAANTGFPNSIRDYADRFMAYQQKNR